jgi:hypothetical protein
MANSVFRGLHLVGKDQLWLGVHSGLLAVFYHKNQMYSDTQPPCLDVGGGYAFAVSVTGLWWPNGVPTAV